MGDYIALLLVCLPIVVFIIGMLLVTLSSKRKDGKRKYKPMMIAGIICMLLPLVYMAIIVGIAHSEGISPVAGETAETAVTE